MIKKYLLKLTREFNNLVVKITVAVKEKYSIVYKKLSKQKQIC